MTAAFCNRKRHAIVQGGYALLRFHFTNKHALRLHSVDARGSI